MVQSKIRISFSRIYLIDLINLLDDITGEFEDLQEAVSYADPAWVAYIANCKKYSSSLYDILKRSDKQSLYVYDFSPLKSE